MKLKDVDLFTWVLYDGQPYNIKEKTDNYSRLKHSNGKIVRISFDKDVDVLEVPTFKVGEKVMCIDNKSPFIFKRIYYINSQQTFINDMTLSSLKIWM